MRDVAVMFGVQNAVFAHVGHVHLGILGVEIIDCVAQIIYDVHYVHSLPDKVRRIDVGAYHRTHGGAQFKQRLGIVNAKARMHFQRYFFHSVGGGKLYGFLPVGNKHFLPLVFQNVLIFRRPRASNPVGLLRLGIAARASRKRDEAFYSYLTRQNAGRFEIFFEFGGNGLVGVDAVAVHRYRRNGGIILFKSIHQRLARRFVMNQHFCIGVYRSRIAAYAQFQLMHSSVGKILQTFVQRHPAENSVYYT